MAAVATADASAVDHRFRLVIPSSFPAMDGRRMQLRLLRCFFVNDNTNVVDHGPILATIDYPKVQLHSRFGRQRTIDVFDNDLNKQLIFALYKDHLVLRQVDDAVNGLYVLRLRPKGGQRCLELLQIIHDMQSQLWIARDPEQDVVDAVEAVASQGSMPQREEVDFVSVEKEEDLEANFSDANPSEGTNDEDVAIVAEINNNVDINVGNNLDVGIEGQGSNLDLATKSNYTNKINKEYVVRCAPLSAENDDSTDDVMVEWSNTEELRAHLDRMMAEPDFEPTRARVQAALGFADNSEDAKEMRNKVSQLAAKYPRIVEEINKALNS